MRLKTLQNKDILDILNSGKIYYADYSKIHYKEYIEQWKMLANLCGFKHCPIFCVPIDNDEAISASQLVQDDHNIILELDVPDNECRLMDYYDFSTYLYYSSGQEYDDYFNFDADQALKNIDKYVTIGEYNSMPQVCIEMIKPEWLVNNLHEGLLLEKTRSQLISQSKSADTVKSYGTTRYGRRNAQHVYNPKDNLNNLDFNSLFKANTLSLYVPVQGETNNYTVEILFDNILKDINRELKNNDYVLEYKVIYRAVVDAINRNNIYVGCSCPDWYYTMSYQATRGQYNAGKPQIIPAKIRNPKDTKGAGCKHVLKVLADLDWALDLASCINNYIIYMEENYPNKYKNIIFPTIYGMSYNKAVDDSIIYPDENIEDEILDEPQDEIIDIENEEEEEY